MKNERLRKSRNEMNLNQEQLAKLLGNYHKSSVSNCENGYATPTLDTTIQISCILKKDVMFLFGNHVQVIHRHSEG